MNDKNYLLAIDNGTQSVRALLFDLQGNLLGKGKVELEAYYSKHPGWAEQDPEYYWAMLGEACRRLWDQVDIDRGLIRGVSLTTQRGTVIHVDAEGRPLRPAILWLDQRRAEVRERIRGPLGLAVQAGRRRGRGGAFPRPGRGQLRPRSSRRSPRRPTRCCCFPAFSATA